MRIACFLPPWSLRRIENALPSDFTLQICGSFDQCTANLERPGADAVILDPLLLDPVELRKVRRKLRSHPVPLLLYTSVTPSTVTRILPALQGGATELILSDVDDSPVRLRKALLSVAHVSVEAGLAYAVAPALREVHPMVVSGLFAILLDPSWNSTKDLPALAHVSRRTVERALMRAQIAPLHRWCSVSRLARSFTALVESNMSHPEAAKIAGFASSRSLDMQYRKIMHVPLAEVRHGLSWRQFVESAAHALRGRAKIA